MEKMSELVTRGIEAIAQISMGQAVLRFTDKMLWIVEASIQWSLPVHRQGISEENGKSFCPVELVRPLPWVLFLPGLIFLRIFRAGINIAATIFGYQRIEPVDMVRYLQRSRRRIRAIKCNGLRNMRLKKTALDKSPETNAKECAEPKTEMNDSKRKYSDISTDDGSSEESDFEDLDAKLDRFAQGNSSSDEDYVPKDEASVNSSTSSNDTLVSLTEIEDIKAEQENMEKIYNGKSDNVEKICDFESKQQPKSLKIHEKIETAPALKPDIVTDDSKDSENVTSLKNFDNEPDIAFFSPDSWKSLSPVEKKAEPTTENFGHGVNGQNTAANGKLDADDINVENGGNMDNPTPESITNDLSKGLQDRPNKQTCQQPRQFFQKNKKFNHGNRKKK